MEKRLAKENYSDLRKSIYFKPGMLEVIKKIEKKLKRRNRSDTICYIIETFAEQNDF